jgi:hypothetical protein
MRKFLLAASTALVALSAAPVMAAPSEGCSTEAVQAMAPPGTTVAMAVREVFADRDEVYSEENWGCRVSGWPPENLAQYQRLFGRRPDGARRIDQKLKRERPGRLPLPAPFNLA